MSEEPPIKELPKTAELLKEITFGTLKFGALEQSDLQHHRVSRDVKKLLQGYRSSQDIIVTLGLYKPLEEDKMKVADPGKLVPAVETTTIATAIARKPFLYKEDGCD